MAAVDDLFNDVLEIFRTLKTHKRYTLRAVSIASILVGSILNFASFLVAFIGYRSGNATRYLTVWTSIVLACSLLWHLVDLASHSDRIFKNKQFMSLNTLLFFDTLGFLSYLALLIANGIIVSDLWHGPTILFAYNSVPWMFCCAIHGVIVLQSISGIITNIGYGSTCCPDCHRKAKMQNRKGGSGAKRGLLGSDESTDDYENIEANVTA